MLDLCLAPLLDLARVGAFRQAKRVEDLNTAGAVARNIQVNMCLIDVIFPVNVSQRHYYRYRAYVGYTWYFFLYWVAVVLLYRESNAKTVKCGGTHGIPDTLLATLWFRILQRRCIFMYLQLCCGGPALNLTSCRRLCRKCFDACL